jgi:hypothetical protein
MATSIDLSSPPTGHEVTLKPVEDSVDKAARLAQESKAANLRRWKDGSLFVVALLGIVLLLGPCG